MNIRTITILAAWSVLLAARGTDMGSFEKGTLLYEPDKLIYTSSDGKREYGSIVEGLDPFPGLTIESIQLRTGNRTPDPSDDHGIRIVFVTSEGERILVEESKPLTIYRLALSNQPGSQRWRTGVSQGR